MALRCVRGTRVIHRRAHRGIQEEVIMFERIKGGV